MLVAFQVFNNQLGAAGVPVDIDVEPVHAAHGPAGRKAVQGFLAECNGIQGLTAPLLQAGARSVVATAWQVSDRSAAKFIDRFYRELAAGKAVVEALRQARLHSIRAGEPPRVWAAFGVVGDPLVTVPLKGGGGRGTGMWWMAAIGGALLLAAIRVRTARASAARSSAARSRR